MTYDMAELLEELEYRQKFGGVYYRYFTEPDTRQRYPKHWEFFDAGATHRIRLFTAGNQVGKSVSAAFELTQHLTGRYHKDWKGKRFDGPVNVWIVGKNSELVRQTIQPTLLGDVGSFGGGFIPQEDLDLETLKDAKKASTPISSFRVKHRNGGYSTVAFKSGEQGREAFQAATLDIVWCDEEIPYDVFNECLVRLMVRKGIMMYSFTPLKGATEVIKSFSVDGEFKEGEVGDSRYVVRCSMYDAAHQTKESIEQLIAVTPPFLRDARVYGIPALGAGAIYPVPESTFVIDPFPLPKHWKKAFGMDVGWKRTAAVWGAIDPESGVLYLYSEHYQGEQVPAVHAEAIRGRGEWIPGVIDPASRGRTQDDGTRLMESYSNLGLDLEKSSNVTEPAMYEIWEALVAGRIKVFSNLTNFLVEFRNYHRDEKGRIVKENDHLLDAFRYLWLSGRDRAKSEMEAITPKVLDGRPTVGMRL